MGDRDANTHWKVVRWIWLGAESFLLSLMPLALVCLILVLCVRGISYLLSAFGIRASGPGTNSAEDAVLLLAMIVVPLLLRIARILEKTASRAE